MRIMKRLMTRSGVLMLYSGEPVDLRSRSARSSTIVAADATVAVFECSRVHVLGPGPRCRKQRAYLQSPEYPEHRVGGEGHRQSGGVICFFFFKQKTAYEI